MAETHARTVRFPFDGWKITETAFRPGDYKLLEGIMALANGYMGQRASFEEGVGEADSLRGNYVAGVFDHYPNATMIKLKGRPTHPSEMVNIPDHLPVEVFLDGEHVELTTSTVEAYARTLHMDTGVMTREVTITTPGGKQARLSFTRFLSRPRRHLAVTRVAVTPVNFSGTITFCSQVNGDVRNASHLHLRGAMSVADETGKFHGVTCATIGTGIDIAVLASETVSDPAAGMTLTQESCRSQASYRLTVSAGKTVTLEKVVAIATSRDLDRQADVLAAAAGFLAEGVQAGFAGLLAEQEAAWAAVWQDVGIEITDKSGTDALTQGLHYSLYQMLQNAPNGDHTVNIGAKGLTGEHYFGTYFWDTEVFMLPMFAFIQPDIARNLVKFRAHTLPGARGKAREMDLCGAAFPFMADADGHECATLWQFGLLGIHITADVAWGIWFYYCTTGDLDFIAEGGIDVMVETSRFWLSRVFLRDDLGKYVINRVLGPDEYHQGVDNNFYTNIMAQENLLKTCTLLERLREENPDGYAMAWARLGLTDDEVAQFRHVGMNIELPRSEVLGVNLQDDRFHLLEPYDQQATPLPGAINAIWSYDRLMRTQLLRQADVVVAHTLLGNRFTTEDIRRDFEYYEPKTTHDSSLSFCSYSVTAAQLRKVEMAYDYYLRTARLDLDDIHGNSWMGVHTACLGGAWQCVVLGFGGVRWYDGRLSLDPLLPAQWEAFTFSIWWHGVKVNVTVRDGDVALHTNGQDVPAMLGEVPITITGTPTCFAHATRMAELVSN